MDHATARLGLVPTPANALFQAELQDDNGHAQTEDDALRILSRVFPNLPIRSLVAEPVDPSLGLWLVRLPILVALEVEAGVDFGWTEVVWEQDPEDPSLAPVDSIYSIFVAAAPF